MMRDIACSLLVPCYNAAAYANKFITHLSTLSLPFTEVIFYDDASTDNTAELLLAQGFRVIKGETNRGPGYARNQLAKVAACPYIHFHDIDDEFNPLFLNLVNKQLSQTPADVVLGQADWVNAENRAVIIKWRYDIAELVKEPLAYFIANPLGIINTVYKKEAFLKVNGFSEAIKCWEDADLHVRLAADGAVFTVIDEILAYSLRHNTGISNNQKWCWGCRLKFLKSYLAAFDKSYATVIGKEMEKAAYNLFQQGAFSKSVEAFRSSRNCGFDAPAINNSSLTLLKKTSPFLAFIIKAVIIRVRP